MKPLEQLVRKNIWSLAPYSSARDATRIRTMHPTTVIQTLYNVR